MKRALGKLSFVREAVAAYYCVRDPKTPSWPHSPAVATGVAPSLITPTSMGPMGPKQSMETRR